MRRQNERIKEVSEAIARHAGHERIVDPDVWAAGADVAAATALERDLRRKAVALEILLDKRQVFAVTSRETGAAHAKSDVFRNGHGVKCGMR